MSLKVPDLKYDDGTSPTAAEGGAAAGATSEAGTAPAAEQETEEFQFAPVGKLPAVSVSVKGLWDKAMEAQGTLLCEMAIYGAW